MKDYEVRHGAFWWAGVILAPIGIIGGPIELATMFSGLVTWHGPIGYTVNFWSETISTPFHNAIQAVVDMAVRLFILPDWKLPKFVSDYLALGTLLASSIWRGLGWGGRHLKPVRLITISVLAVLFWPWLFLILVRVLLPPIPRIDATQYTETRDEKARRDFKLKLILAPFILFLFLLAINVIAPIFDLAAT